MLRVVYDFFPPFFYLHCDLWCCSAQLLCVAAASMAGSHTHCSSQNLAHLWHKTQTFHFLLVICHHHLCALEKTGWFKNVCMWNEDFIFFEWGQGGNAWSQGITMVWIWGDLVLASASFILDIIITELIFLKRILASGLDCQEKNINWGWKWILDHLASLRVCWYHYFMLSLLSERFLSAAFTDVIPGHEKTSCESFIQWRVKRYELKLLEPGSWWMVFFLLISSN